MRTLRNWYILAVVAIALPSLVWAVIWLLRLFLIPDLLAEVSILSLPLAVVIIGGPIYLGHWVWWTVICRREADQENDPSYYFFLYGMMGLFLSMVVAQLYVLFYRCLGFLTDRATFYDEVLEKPGETIFYHAIALVILGGAWLYHRWLATPTGQRHENAMPSRSLYLYTLAGLGWFMVTIASHQFVRLLLGYDNPPFRYVTYTELRNATLVNYLPGLMLGGGLWFVYWFAVRTRSLQNGTDPFVLFIRQLYLYGILFVAMMGTVVSAAALLAGLFRRLFAVPSSGDVRDALAIIFMLGVWWVYHAYELQQDEKRARQTTTDTPVPTGIQRLYLYMVASIGLAALLIGLIGGIHALLDLLDSSFLSSTVKDAFANSLATIIAGLPVWLLPWHVVSRRARAPQVVGTVERQSVLRKLYLYAYLFLAAIAVLGNAIYIVFRLLYTLLGGELHTSLLANIAESIAYGAIGLVLWLYHWYWLRQDGRFAAAQEQKNLRSVQILVLGQGEASVEHKLVKKIEQTLPRCHVTYFDLDAAAVEGSPLISQQLKDTELIIGPWPLAFAGNGHSLLPGGITAEVVHSSAPKIMIPHPVSGWDWAGLEKDNDEVVIESVVDKVKKLSLRQPA